jgi:hypothetical protein
MPNLSLAHNNRITLQLKVYAKFSTSSHETDYSAPLDYAKFSTRSHETEYCAPVGIGSQQSRRCCGVVFTVLYLLYHTIP